MCSLVSGNGRRSGDYTCVDIGSCALQIINRYIGPHFPRASLFILNHFSTCLSYRITVTPQLSTCSSWLCFKFSLYTCATRYSECQVLCGHEVLSLFWIKWVNTFSEILFCFNKLLGFECMTVLCWSHGNPAHGRFTATYV